MGWKLTGWLREQASCKFPAAKPPQKNLIPDPCPLIPDPWTRHVAKLAAHGIPEPGSSLEQKPATLADARKLYDVAPSFADLLPWAKYLPESQSLLFEARPLKPATDGRSEPGNNA